MNPPKMTLEQACFILADIFTIDRPEARPHGFYMECPVHLLGEWSLAEYRDAWQVIRQNRGDYTAAVWKARDS